MTQRVLFMISSLRGGGSEQQTLLLLRALDRSRFTPHLYLTEKAGELLSSIPDDVVLHSFDDVRSSGGLYYPGRVMRKQIRHLRDVLTRNSIDVIYDRTFHMTMIAGPASSRTRTPHVSTIVSPPEHALPLVETRFVSVKKRRLSRAYRQAQAVVAVSKQAAESAERFYGLASGSVHVIRNGVDVEDVVASAKQMNPSRDQRLTLACVGRMTTEKGHRDLISAVSLIEAMWPDDLPPMRIWMIGDGPLREDLQAQWDLIKQSNSTSCRHTIEFVGAQRCPASFMAAADALVLPSHFEGMPNVVLEAMALGTPVIATRAGGTVELERDLPTILWAEPSDPPSLARAMTAFAQDRDAARRRAAAATDLIRQHHSIKQVAQSIENLLLRVSD